MENKIAHLGFVQGVINRMGTNSFLIKSWSVTLVSALFVLSTKESSPVFALLAYFPVFVFWWLDAYFLHQERLFRKLYEGIANGEIESEQFTLDTCIVKNKVDSIFKVLVSPTLRWFHGIIVFVVLLGMLLLTFARNGV